MASKPKTTPDTQAVRRMKFGLNITLQVALAIGVVIFVNLIASWQYLRLDLTQDRSYSLSAQSKTVLNKLDGEFKIYTLLPSELDTNSEQAVLVYRRVRDLVDEYARYGESLTAEHLDARSDIFKAESLNAAIAKAYDDELAPAIEAITLGRAALNDLGPLNDQLIAVMMSGLSTDSTIDPTPAQDLYQLAATRCKQIKETAESAGQQTDELLDQVLVNYAGIKEQIQSVLTDYNTVLGVITQRSDQLVRSDQIENADKERLLEIIELCKQAQGDLTAPLEKMGAAEPSPRYNQALYALTSGASVVVLGEDRVKVLPVSEMYREDTRALQETGRTQPQYLIEEKITGAMLSMTMDQPPLVVFVLSGSGPALGEQGQFNLVAQRLENADFRVTQWNPAGQMSQMGQPTPPQPRPQAEPGQKTVWIIMPTISSQMNNPMMMAANPRQQIADLLNERLPAGDAAFLLLAADPSAAVGIANPITDLLNTWGITPQLDRLVLQEIQQDNRRTATAAEYLIDTWPTDLPITSALQGMQAHARVVCPILTSESEGTQHHPLMNIEGPRIWAHSDLSSPQAVQNAKFVEAQSADSFTVAIASEKDGQRLVTSGDYAWPSDAYTSYGLLGPGTAELTGAAFPANSELFVNSVFWLAGLEDLIAASPRAQDVPRINPMSPGTRWWYQFALLAGIPLAVLVIGLTVWWSRRRA